MTSYSPPNYYVPSEPPEYNTLVHQYHSPQAATASDVNLLNPGWNEHVGQHSLQSDVTSGGRHQEAGDSGLPPPPTYSEVIVNMDKYVKHDSRDALNTHQLNNTDNLATYPIDYQ